MRSVASDESAPGCASAASAAPDGGPAALVPAEPAVARTAASTATAKAAVALAERLTRVRVEEVQPADVDGDGNVRLEAEHDVRRELRDEVRPRTDRALGDALLDLLADLHVADRPCLDPEVGDRLGAERLDEIDARVERRQVRPLGPPDG